jgi:hypothetical protein
VSSRQGALRLDVMASGWLALKLRQELACPESLETTHHDLRAAGGRKNEPHWPGCGIALLRGTHRVRGIGEPGLRHEWRQLEALPVKGWDRFEDVNRARR